MASPPSVRRALKRVLENPKASCKARLHALAQLQRLGPSTAILERLLRDPDLPTRLLSAVVIAYDAKLEIQRWNRERKKAAATPNVLGTLSE